MSSVFDLAEEDSGSFNQERSTDADKARVSTVAQQLVAAAQEVADLDQKLKAAKFRHKNLEEVELPEAMDKVGLSSFTTKDGYSVTVKQSVTASVTADRKPAVIDWLEENGHDGIVKNEVVVSFDKGEVALAEEFREFARGFNAKPVSPRLSRDVNTGTLKSLVKELVGQGESVPLDLLGVYMCRKASVKQD